MTPKEKEEFIEQVADAVFAKLQAAASDDTVMGPVWKKGANTIGQHTMDAISLWVGRKVVHFVLAAAATGAIAWAVLTKRV